MDTSLSKRIVLCSIGSRGDCQPYIALGLDLKSRGHHITIATEQRNSNLVLGSGLNFSCIAGDSCGMLYEPKYQKTLRDGSFIGLINMTNEWNAKFDKKEILSSFMSALAGAEIIISGALTLTQTYCVAEANNVVWIPMILGPTLCTNEFPIWALSFLTFGFSCLNKWTYNVVFKSLWDQEKSLINPWRQDTLQLPPITAKSGVSDLMLILTPPILIACSTLICGPRQAVPADYPLYAHLNGFIFVPTTDESNIDPVLKNFIYSTNISTNATNAAGSTIPRDGIEIVTNMCKPIIYLGFGSMPTPDPLALIHLTIQLYSLLHCRVVVIAGWSELQSAECIELLTMHKENILVIKSAPHDWLFPKVDCIVHHAGIGTTAAALRSGKPQIPCPVMLDQTHNAKIIVDLNCAPCYLPYSSLTTQKLYQAIMKVIVPIDGEKYRVAAMKCGEYIRKESEEGIDKYCNIVENATVNWNVLNSKSGR